MSLSGDLVKEIRTIVQQAISEALQANGLNGGLRPVSITNDSELASFVEMITTSPMLEQVQNGTVGFSLLPNEKPQLERNYRIENLPQSSREPDSAQASQNDVFDGVVTERMIKEIPEGSLLRLAIGSIVTPTARDVARERNITMRKVDK